MDRQIESSEPPSAQVLLGALMVIWIFSGSALIFIGGIYAAPWKILSGALLILTSLLFGLADYFSGSSNTK